MQWPTKILLMGGLAGLALSCSLPHEPGPQPTRLDDTGTQSLINVFGVLRPDSGASFIQVEASYSLETAEDQEPKPLPLGEVMVVDSAYNDTTYFMVSPDDTMQHHYALEGFLASTGHTYLVSVEIPGYPRVTGSTTIPPVPGMAGPPSTAPGYLKVMIDRQNGIHSYELHLVLDDGDVSHLTKLVKTVVMTGENQVAVEFRWTDKSMLPLHLTIYGYERNLGEYLGTTISFKPQSYQPQDYYVVGGAGVIGALNFTAAMLLDD